MGRDPDHAPVDRNSSEQPADLPPGPEDSTCASELTSERPSATDSPEVPVVQPSACSSHGVLFGDTSPREEPQGGEWVEENESSSSSLKDKEATAVGQRANV